MSPGEEALTDDELVYRRVPHRDEFLSGPRRASPLAFRPHPESDRDGLSFFRKKYATALETVADRGPGKPTFLAPLLVLDIRGIGLEILPAPLPENPGHCVVPGLNSMTPKPVAVELRRQLALVAMRLEGPFGSPSVRLPDQHS